MSNTVSRRTLAKVVASKLLAEPQQRQRWIQTLAAYLVEAGRADEVDLIVNDIARELYEQHGELLVRVTSARPLSAQVNAELRRLLKEATQARTVTLTETLDPTLIGGLVARTPDAQLDVSLQTTLKQLATIK